MVPSVPTTRDREWLDYYRRFNYFSAEAVREHCYPRIMEHKERPTKAIVLVHGLSDSPYLMTAIGKYFFDTLNYNVYLPLLHCHGLKEPNGMEEVALDKWKANVKFAVEIAKAKADHVSIGGLSTGGTLSFYTAMMHPDLINGALYLFSAALDLTISEKKERIVRIPGVVNLAELIVKGEALIGPDPYRYANIDWDGARALSELIKETDALISSFNDKKPLAKWVFAAHSESDKTADIGGIEALERVSVREQFKLWRIPAADNVSHAGLVLKDPLVTTDAAGVELTLEEANPRFADMMTAIAEWEKST